MADIGIVGSGIAGLQLGLALQQEGIPATIYAERTPAQQLSRRLTNMVARNARTRAREQRLGVNHWDVPAYDMVRFNMSIRGPQPIEFSGRFPAPVHAVDMRIYWARLLEDFSNRGGRVVIRTFDANQLDGLASEHDLVVVATGRSSLTSLFPRIPEHSPFSSPQRLCVGGLFHGVRYTDPRALEVVVNRGHGEMLGIPIQSFEPDLTGIAILVATGGAFEVLRHLRCGQDPRPFVRTVLDLLRAYAPAIYERIDRKAFDLAGPLDLCYAAITPTVRGGFVQLSNGRYAVALGDAHVVMDPVTGQGANSASHAALALAAEIRNSRTFDRSFCQRVEQQICAYVMPVSAHANSRLRPPEPHFVRLLSAAARHQAVADAYADGFNHPDRFWATASSAERTAAFLRAFDEHEQPSMATA